MKLNRVHHLPENVLFEAYVSGRRGTPPDPRVAEHLADCPACDRRYAEIAGLMDDASLAADLEIDELFPPERRRAQAQRILLRVEHAGRPARVLSFPARAVARRIGAGGPRIATRWIAAGAAAGLFIGVGLGLFFNFDAGRTATPTMAAARPPQPSAAISARRPTPLFSSEADEEAFLSDLDLALERPHTPVLLGYDELTPHVRDIADIR